MKPTERNLKTAMDRRLSGMKVEEQHIENVLSKAQGKQPRRKALSLILAFALVALLGTALAMNWSATVNWIERMYGSQWADELKAGTHMPIHQVKVLGRVQYEVLEAIYMGEGQADKEAYSYQHKSLFGTIRITPVAGANIVLMPEDTLIIEHIGYNSHKGETAPPDTPTFIEKALEKDAPILIATARPHGVLIDGKLQEGWEIMYDYSSHEDGSLSYHFQAPMVPEMPEYQIQMSIQNWEITSEGDWLRDGPDSTWEQDMNWVITVRPEGE
ncbi:MAG: hypothetical protein GX611_03810 [Clostridiales bacterium]|nr:hypothetical protein [Clostridiales bacterium]